MIFFPEEKDEDFHMGKHAVEKVEGLITSSYIFTSNPQIVRTLEDFEEAHDGIRYIIPKKLDHLFKCTNDYNIKCHNDITEVDLKSIFPQFPGFLETKKFVDFKNNEII